MQDGIETLLLENPSRIGAFGFLAYAYNADIDDSAEIMAEDGQFNAQLAAEDTVQVVSADAADTTQTLTLFGIDETGHRTSEQFALNGDTAVDSAKTWRYVENCFLSAECAGEITIRRKTGPATIMQITVGQLQTYVCHFFTGEREAYLTYFEPLADDSVTDSVIFELRWYPDDADCLDAADGYHVLDRRTAAVVGTVLSQPPVFCPPQPIRLPAGGWLAVYATGAAANQTGSARIIGFRGKRT